MNLVRLGFLCLAFWSAAIAFGNPSDVFEIQKDPGSGTLTFSQGEAKQAITLGATTGLYGLGLVFDSKRLSPEIQNEFQKQKILQIVLGTQPNQLQGRRAQWMTALVTLPSLPRKSTSYPLGLPVGGTGPKEKALLSFQTLLAPTVQNDAEKLQSTYFARDGQFRLRVKGKGKRTTAMSGDGTLAFRRKTLSLKINADLITPFNPKGATLKGTIAFPVYWPTNAKAKALVDKMAEQSLTSLKPP